ncbi:hypothetical protein Pmani_015134 [Petrolisthes manimaculis]|uniref:Small acidic protein-like domain-containing protein n=1 Tax=Petrolisthes manimaculis TaxID=1843537 RepID=A0AAE1U7Z3_9EUCA|nr:hypothetical protein Pmani_015134 [Petrolisthes manimaculis]
MFLLSNIKSITKIITLATNADDNNDNDDEKEKSSSSVGHFEDKAKQSRARGHNREALRGAMNALQSYSSDEESGNEAPIHKTRKASDLGTNYDDVGMDISEDSDDDLGSHNTNAATRERGRPPPPPGSNSTRPPGGPSPPSAPSQAHSSDSDKTDSRESHRSSLQERLLGLASGQASQRQASGEDRSTPRERRDSNRVSNPLHNGDGQSRRKSRSKSPKPISSSKSRSQRSQSPGGGKRNNQKARSRSKSRERDSGRGGQLSRDHSSKGHVGRDQGNQGSHSGRGRDGRKDDRKRRDDERRSRRSRSRSRSRERRRSRSRSRDRRSRSRSRERRHRSRSRERKRPMDIRKEAQQKLAALKAANPDLTAAELLKRSMEAQVMEVQKQTGITLPSYYNPAAMNPMKFAEQERKKKLLWGNKNKPGEINNPPPPLPPPQQQLQLQHHQHQQLPPQIPQLMGSPGVSYSYLPHNPALRPSPLAGAGMGGSGSSSGGNNAGTGGQAALWANTKFSNDRDGKLAEKFRRLMGVKSGGGEAAAAPPPTPASAPPPTTSNKGGKDTGVELLQKQETMFTSMERQYEMARLATHTHKGFGLAAYFVEDVNNNVTEKPVIEIEGIIVMP